MKNFWTNLFDQIMRRKTDTNSNSDMVYTSGPNNDILWSHTSNDVHRKFNSY